MRPESIVAYARSGEAFEPIFVHGRAVPPAIDGQSPLITTLQGRSSPLASNRLSRRDRIEQLSLFDRAALETLAAIVVVPIRRRTELVAFLCLGHKHSGDIYSGTDLALLTAVANTVSTQLELSNQEEVAREARAMQEELRRYVPGAIARGLDAGEDLEPRERAVTVLFVDIRGYVRFAEGQAAEQIFSTVNRYTETVSTIVKSHGGSVVEFSGDGMMVVFGAPDPLPEKEGAAVAAAREIVVATQAHPGELSVGVGIATGSAYVGSIRSADRMIWSVIGNTTNLAARLQSLTRDLDASIAIDAATWDGAGSNCADFVCHAAMRIRGRSNRQDVFALPLPGTAPGISRPTRGTPER